MLHSLSQSGTNRWSNRLLTLSLAAAAAASVVFWVLQWPGKAPAPLATVADTPAAVIDSNQIARLLGAGSAADAGAQNNAAEQTDIELLGVIAPGKPNAPDNAGSALLAVSEAPARPYRVGDEVADGLVLQTIKSRSVVLGRPGQSQGLVTLDLPLLPGMTDKP